MQYEASSGIFLMISVVLALIIANSPVENWYETILQNKLGIEVADFKLQKAVILWINDFLMAGFFLLIGLEIKREILVGELRSVRKALLPAIAAVGGVTLPIVIFLLINIRHPEN